MIGKQTVSTTIVCVQFKFESDFLFFRLFFSFSASDKSVSELVSRYIKEIEKLRAKLIESEQMYQQLKKVVSATRKNIITFADTDGLCCMKSFDWRNRTIIIIIANYYFVFFCFSFPKCTDVEEVIDMAKRKLEKERELFMSKSLPGFNSENQSNTENENENDSSDDSESDESEEKGNLASNMDNFVINFSTK